MKLIGEPHINIFKIASHHQNIQSFIHKEIKANEIKKKKHYKTLLNTHLSLFSVFHHSQGS